MFDTWLLQNNTNNQEMLKRTSLNENDVQIKYMIHNKPFQKALCRA